MSLDEQIHEGKAREEAYRRALTRFALLYEHHTRANPDVKDTELVKVAVGDLRAAKQILEAIPR